MRLEELKQQADLSLRRDVQHVLVEAIELRALVFEIQRLTDREEQLVTILAALQDVVEEFSE